MNRVLARTGARDPIIQAPMGWIARSGLASAVSRAGGLRSIETSSGETAHCQREITLMAASGLPFGVNLPIRFLKDDAMLRFVCDALADLPVRFVTTSAGSPAKFSAPLKAAGIVVHLAVPTLETTLKCVDAGVDGLVVEGAEGGGFKNPEEVSTLAADSRRRHRRRPRHGGRVRARRRAHTDGAHASSPAPRALCTSTSSKPSSPPRPPAPGC